MERRAVFGNRLLPYALLAPQLAITIVFFYWPASQAVKQSFMLEDAFGLSSTFVGFENYAQLLRQADYFRAVGTTVVFSVAVTVISLASALLLAVMADRQIRGASVYKTLLIWPYAVAGLVLPLIASATGTLLFRQFFMTIPDELLEASKIDGAGPLRFFRDTVLPLSVTTIAALFVIQFIYGWNQYLWPLLITTKDSMQTIVIAIKKMITTQDALTEWQLAMATAVLAMLPPVAVVVLMQRLFVKGLVETEK
jgi:ABC-type glycerol-3-phosphate transport system permease component